MSVLADTGKNVEHFAATRGGVLDTVGREQRKTKFFRKIDQLTIDAFLAPNEMALQLDVNALAPKNVD